MGEAGRRVLALSALLVLAAGCAVVAPPAAPSPSREESPAQAAERRAAAPRPVYNLTGYPPAMKEGYIDGCESAKGSAHGRRDDKRLASDTQYSQGWKDGFAICGKRQ